MTHAETRKHTLVDKLYNLGLSISYDRVLELSTDMGNSIQHPTSDERMSAPDVPPHQGSFVRIFPGMREAFRSGV